MNRKLLIAGTFASLAFAAPSRAAKSGSGLSLVPGATRQKVVCRDVRSVPVTVDAEQALPLRLVANLHCGEEVAVLSDAGGYTVQVRTADGKHGYVARLHLATAPPPSPARTSRPVENAPSQNGIVRWQLGAPGTDRLYNGTSMVESLTANGVTVQVSLQDTGWKLRASVAVANAGDSQVHVNPASFTLDELTPRLRPLRYQKPEELGKSRTHQAFSTKSSAIAPPSAVYVNDTPQKRRLIIAAPNFLADLAQPDQSSVLYEAVLGPHEKASGSVWFERDKNLQQLNLRVFVGDQIFEFPLSFAQR